jgi:hypothetical protein
VISSDGKEAAMPLSPELRAEIDTNDVAFAALEPGLLIAHTGHYALMRHGQLVGIFDGIDAALESAEAFADELFTLPKIGRKRAMRITLAPDRLDIPAPLPGTITLTTDGTAMLMRAAMLRAIATGEVTVDDVRQLVRDIDEVAAAAALLDARPLALGMPTAAGKDINLPEIPRL